MTLWLIGGLFALWFAGLFSKDSWGTEKLPPTAGISPALAAAIPSIIGGIASLFKGKKTKYAAQQTPQQAAAYNQLLRMLQQRMGQPSAGMGAGNDAMNILYSTFLGKGFTPTVTREMPLPGDPVSPKTLRRRW